MSVTIGINQGRIVYAVIAAAAIGLSGCRGLLKKHGSPSAVPYTTLQPASGSFAEEARELNSHGLRAFEVGHLLKAERLFRDSLEVDVSFGPAHNNLGQVYLASHQLYLAAWEFEYAANLMPELVEPIINQGLAYETGERIDRAAEYYQEAYDRQPNHPVAIASLVRARIKQDGDPSEIAFLLDELIMYDGRREWVEWAKELRATKYRDQCEDCEIIDMSPTLRFDSGANDSGDSVQIREELLPMESLPSPEWIAPETQESSGDDSGIEHSHEHEDIAPPSSDLSSFRGKRRPKRLPLASRSKSTGQRDGRPSGRVKQVSLDSPLLLPTGTAP